MTIYLSGAIQNDANHVEKFKFYHNILTERGYIVYNPLTIEARFRITNNRAPTRVEILLEDLKAMTRVERLAVIADNIASPGRDVELSFFKYMYPKWQILEIINAYDYKVTIYGTP